MPAARPPREIGGAPRASARARSLGVPLGWGAVVVSATVVVALVDPHVAGRYPRCPLLVLTGFACPLCGALRATHDLAHLDLAGALAANPWWVVVALGLVAAWGTWTVRTWRAVRAGPGRGRPARPGVRWSPRLVGLVVAVLGASAVVFGVARNVPALGGVLGPAG